MKNKYIELHKKIVGKTLGEAEKIIKDLGYSRIRATKIDGAPALVTRDFIVNRANVALVDGKITNIESFG